MQVSHDTGSGHTVFQTRHALAWVLRPSYMPSHAPFLIFMQALKPRYQGYTRISNSQAKYDDCSRNGRRYLRLDCCRDSPRRTFPRMFKPMDNTHGNVNDILNKASGYEVNKSLSLFLLSVNRCQRESSPTRADHICRPPCPTPTPRTARRRMQRKCLSN